MAVTVVGVGGELNNDDELVRGLRRSPDIIGRPLFFLDVPLPTDLILGFAGGRNRGCVGDSS